MSYCIVNTTTSNKKNAVEIARHLIENKLAACVNIVPNIVSVYTWDSNICEGQEFLLVIKTQRKLFKKVEKAILEKHEYELPEIVATCIDKGNDKYLKWIKSQTV
ncbi:MAG: divalent-cation tolerance protein CutA [Candidatus Gastranaerophilales bacterium]|nr:divalent-cation tolerance protein CutA [Candidatus Gastranaerophilales bacterium]